MRFSAGRIFCKVIRLCALPISKATRFYNDKMQERLKRPQFLLEVTKHLSHPYTKTARSVRYCFHARWQNAKSDY